MFWSACSVFVRYARCVLRVLAACFGVPPAYLEGARSVFELQGRSLSGGYLQRVWMVPAQCSEGISSLFGGCAQHVLGLLTMWVWVKKR